MLPVLQPAMRAVRRLGANRRGVAAVEFAILLPLLLVTLAVTVEVARLTMIKRQFENCVVAIARLIVRYPEYERRAREFAPPVAEAMFPEGSANLDLSVDSLHMIDGNFVEMFPRHVLFGEDPGQSWADHISKNDYVEDEAVVFIAARYEYKPLFDKVLPTSFTFQTTYVILPHFSRKYPWNDNQVDRKYVY